MPRDLLAEQPKDLLADQAPAATNSQPSAPARRNERGFLEGAIRTAVHGATFGASDEIMGVLGTPVELIAQFVRGDEISIPKAFERRRAFAEEPVKQFREDNPVVGLGLEIGGAVASGAGILNRVGAGVGGAVAGATVGFFGPDGDLEERGRGAAAGALLGAAGGKFADMLLSRVTTRFGSRAPQVAQNPTRRALQGQAPQGQNLSTQAQQNLALSDEFRVPLTRGQASDDFLERSFEDAASKGGRGPGPVSVLRPFYQDQREAVLRAGRDLGGQRFQGLNSAGETVSEGVKAAARDLRDQVDAAYDAARRAQADLSADAVPDFVATVKGAVDPGVADLLQGGADDVARIFPGTGAAMRLADNLVDEIARAGQNGGQVTAVQFDRFEMFRRTLNQLIDGSKSSDRRALLAMKANFDGWMDGAVTRQLFNGNQGFLDAYRRARSLRTDFARRFEGSRANVGGQALNDIVTSNADEVQTINYLLGVADNFGGKKVLPAVQTIKEALGANSEGFQALREAAVFKIMRTGEQAGKDRVAAKTLATAFRNATDGRGAPVFRELFSADELNRMRRFERLLRVIDPPEGSVQVSATALERARAALEGIGLAVNIPVQRLNRFLGAIVPDQQTARATRAVNPRQTQAVVNRRAPSDGRAAGGAGVAVNSEQ